jgi:hypothetical protein
LESSAEKDAPALAVADMAPLVRRLQTFMAEHAADARVVADGAVDPEALADRTGYRPRRGGPAEVVLGGDVGVELGHPAVGSQSLVLLTEAPGLVAPGRVTLVGPDVGALPRGTRQPFGQAVLIQRRPGPPPDPFALETAQYLVNRLPGYMVRTVPPRLWVRISRQALAAELDLASVGQALVATYTRDFTEIAEVEVVFVTQSEEAVAALASIAREAAILAGRHKKLRLAPDGELECPDLDCDQCDEREVCDALRDVIIKRRRRSA